MKTISHRALKLAVLLTPSMTRPAFAQAAGGMPDLGSLMIALTSTFPWFTAFVAGLIGLFGVYAGTAGLVDAYSVALGSASALGNRQPTPAGAVLKVVLGGAMIVSPYLLWQAGNTFVAGGAQTFNMFNYADGTSRGTYCLDFQSALTFFFQALGMVAWFFAFNIIYKRINGDHGGLGSPWLYFVGGTLCFFINDVAKIIQNSTGMNIGFENICTALGGGGA